MKRSTFRRHKARLEVVLAFALALTAGAGAQQSAPPAAKAPECGSVVVVRCDAKQAEAAAPRRAAVERIEARRRAVADPFELDRVIIEADPVRRSLEEALAAPFSRPSHGTHSYRTAEGSQCSCMNRCPPIPFPCCQCSPYPSRYTTSPGYTPLR